MIYNYNAAPNAKQDRYEETCMYTKNAKHLPHEFINNMCRYPASSFQRLFHLFLLHYYYLLLLLLHQIHLLDRMQKHTG
jgi:hypothetical protein